MSKYSDKERGRQTATKAAESGKRPECVTDEHLTFLDDLRESGVTNMYGAGPYIAEEFPDLTDEEVACVHVYWMRSFGKPDR